MNFWKAVRKVVTKLWEIIRHYFNNPNGDDGGGGLQRLMTVAQSGHKAANVYGMITLSSENDDSRKEGIEHLRPVL